MFVVEKRCWPSQLRIYVTLTACFLELIFYGGTIIGWASLAFVFKKDGLFSLACPDPVMADNDSSNCSLGVHMCQNHSQVDAPSDCATQEQSLSLVFTVGISFFGLASFPVGWIFDKFGLKLTRMFATVNGIGGYMLLGWAEKETSWMLFPGAALMATSCITMILTNTYVARMAGKKSSTIISLYAGSISSAVVVFLAVKLLHDAGISRKISLTALSLFWIPTMAVTCFLLPSQPNPVCCSRSSKYKVSPTIHKPASEPRENANVYTVTENGYAESKAGDSVSNKASKVRKAKMKLGPSDNVIIRYILGNRQVPAVVEDMLSLYYLLYIYWYCALHIRMQLFIAQFNIWVGTLVDQDQHQVSHFTNVLGYAMLTSMFTSPIGGIAIDSLRGWTKGMAPAEGCRSIVAVPSLLLVGVCSVGLSLLVHATRPVYVYAVIVAAEIFRTFFYASSLALLELSFPRQHYGRLFGLARSIGGLMSFLQYPYVLWANSSFVGLISVRIFLLLTILGALSLPIYIIILYTRHRRRVATQETAQNNQLQLY